MNFKNILTLIVTTFISTTGFAFIDASDIFPSLGVIENADYYCQDQEGGGLAFNIEQNQAWMILSPADNLGMALVDTTVSVARCPGCFGIKGVWADEDFKAEVSLVTRYDIITEIMTGNYIVIGEEEDEKIEVELTCNKEMQVK